MTIAIAAVLHDPNLIVHRKLLELSKDPIFKDNFFAVVSKDTPIFAYTTATPDVIYYTQSGYGIADARRCCLRWFLSVPRFNKFNHLLLLDFDRLLYWLHHDRDTLMSIISDAYSPYICIGRTEKAMQSHPEIQRNTERGIIAYTFTLLFPEDTAWDFVAGTQVVDTYTAKYILDNSYAIDPGAVDVEWYCLARRFLLDTMLVQHAKVDGLGYEGAWIGLEPTMQNLSWQNLPPGKEPALKELERKRYANFAYAKMMVDTIKTWRSYHDRCR